MSDNKKESSDRDIWETVLSPDLIAGALAGGIGGRFVGKRVGRFIRGDAAHYGKQQRRYEQTEQNHLNKMHQDDLGEAAGQGKDWDEATYDISSRHDKAQSARRTAAKYGGKALRALGRAATAANVGTALGATAGYATAGAMKHGKKRTERYEK